MLSAEERARLLSVCRDHAKRFDAIATDRDRRAGVRSESARPVLSLPSLQESPGGALSARELDVLTLISSGFGNAEIGRRLFVSEETVKTHIRKILMKLHARNRAHAAALGVRRGLVELVA